MKLICFNSNSLLFQFFKYSGCSVVQQFLNFSASLLFIKRVFEFRYEPVSAIFGIWQRYFCLTASKLLLCRAVKACSLINFQSPHSATSSFNFWICPTICFSCVFLKFVPAQILYFSYNIFPYNIFAIYFVCVGIIFFLCVFIQA